MLHQVLKGQEWIANTCFRPVNEYAPRIVQENIAGIDVVVCEGLRDIEFLHLSAGCMEDSADFQQFVSSETRHLSGYLVFHHLFEIVDPNIYMRLNSWQSLIATPVGDQIANQAYASLLKRSQGASRSREI
jgi:hypothetical protein